MVFITKITTHLYICLARHCCALAPGSLGFRYCVRMKMAAYLGDDQNAPCDDDAAMCVCVCSTIGWGDIKYTNSHWPNAMPSDHTAGLVFNRASSRTHTHTWASGVELMATTIETHFMLIRPLLALWPGLASNTKSICGLGSPCAYAYHMCICAEGFISTMVRTISYRCRHTEITMAKWLCVCVCCSAKGQHNGIYSYTISSIYFNSARSALLQ